MNTNSSSGWDVSIILWESWTSWDAGKSGVISVGFNSRCVCTIYHASSCLIVCKSELRNWTGLNASSGRGISEGRLIEETISYAHSCRILSVQIGHWRTCIDTCIVSRVSVKIRCSWAHSHTYSYIGISKRTSRTSCHAHSCIIFSEFATRTHLYTSSSVIVAVSSIRRRTLIDTSFSKIISIKALRTYFDT